MRRVDIAIIGAGRAGRDIADQLSGQYKGILLLALPGGPEDYFRHLYRTLLDAGAAQIDSQSVAVTQAKSTPQFIDPKTLVVDGEKIQAGHFVIASGCSPIIPAEFQNQSFQLAGDVLSDLFPPKSATIVGAGPIGVCLASYLAQKGAAVSLWSRAERILSKEDPEIAQSIQLWLAGLGVRIELNAKSFPTDNAILATGLRPNSAGFDLPKAGVYVQFDGQIAVDEEMRTPNRRVHAAGTVTGPVFNLAHEDWQAHLIAHNIPAPFFNREKILPEPYPFVFPSNPPWARIGLTEKEIQTQVRGGLAVNCSTGKNHIKLLGRKKTAELVGAHIFGPGADALILYFDLLMRAGISLRDVTEKHHYPSLGLAESAGEAIKSWLHSAGE